MMMSNGARPLYKDDDDDDDRPATLSISTTQHLVQTQDKTIKMLTKRLPRLVSSPLFWLLAIVVSFSLISAIHTPTRGYLRTKLKGGSDHIDYYPSNIESNVYNDLFPNATLPDLFHTKANRELGKRLSAFLNRPIRSTQAATEINEKTCPPRIVDHLQLPSQNFLFPFDGLWSQVDEVQIARKRSSLVRWLEGKLEDGELNLEEEHGRNGGRGIVITGGNGDTTQRVIRLLKHLKHFKCPLPIEIFHFPGEMGDEKENTVIRKLGAKIRQVSKEPRAGRNNYQIKIYAILESSFDEVLYLDSDNIPLRDPSYLFKSHLYQTYRAVFWPDGWKDHAYNAIWRIFGQDCHMNDFTFESGQIILDKTAHRGLFRAALWMAAGMLVDQDFYGQMLLGDKDTFRWSWNALELEYGRAPRLFGALGHPDHPEEQGEGRFCGTTMVQYDLDVPPGKERQEPLFIHANMLKYQWDLPWEYTFTKYKRMKLDGVNEPSLLYGHYTMYGICTDIVWEESATEEERGGNELIELSTEYALDGVFEGLKDRWMRLSGMDD
ncbi:mannosyltransferase putative-domain-containing protein [Naematelia encephala]|uniref:Mannosyltransferase putative-domain-containing protein n=1 Tax=Naematelia encephala TaxID=71784 RepID=A0A1Y2B7V6_9TREE|nr:mannosyltransferase putative-domain-containing protein [Naematelia encephala]